jgi:hypothetical protein
MQQPETAETQQPGSIPAADVAAAFFHHAFSGVYNLHWIKLAHAPPTYSTGSTSALLQLETVLPFPCLSMRTCAFASVRTCAVALILCQPCRIHQQMLQLETAQVQQAGSIPATDVAAAYASINAQLNSLVAAGDDVEDTATRSALLFMDALFNSSSSSDDAPAEASSSSSSRGGVSLQKLQRLGKFLQAAACLEPYQTLLSVLSQKHPHLASEEMLWVSWGLGFSGFKIVLNPIYQRYQHLLPLS